MDTIAILTTGGTIDKVYFDAKSKYEVGPPNIGAILSEMNLSLTWRLESLMRKDSLEITESDRVIIRTAVENTPERRILITHGTDTMVDTALYLSEIPDKIIVLTGAIEPALFKTSDALFNIGCGLVAVQTAPPGVYIAMNGRIFESRNVRKNLERNRFEEIE